MTPSRSLSSRGGSSMDRWSNGLLVALSIALVGPGCQKDAAAPGKTEAAAGKPKPVITNRVDVPAAVRQNLGITFRRAEERHVAKTLRLPGYFELAPTARRPHHSTIPGIVTLRVQPLQKVAEGDLLATIQSPALIERRHELHLASDAVGAAEDAHLVASKQLRATRGDVDQLARRLKRLRKAGAPNADLAERESTLRRKLSVLKAEATSRQRDVTRARHRFEAELLAFATIMGMPVESLAGAEESDGGDHDAAKPTWETLTHLEIRAASAGTVAATIVQSGSWVEAGAKLLEVHEPSHVRFVASVLATDLTRLRDGMSATLVPSASELSGHATGSLQLDTIGDPKRRLTRAYVDTRDAPTWARPGATGFVEVVNDTTEQKEVAIPSNALIRDGLHDVFFRRDPADPDKVIRVEAERGPSDGRWVVVFSGIAPGDEVVVDGAYELKLASTAKPAVKGHFHADGTFHEGED